MLATTPTHSRSSNFDRDELERRSQIADRKIVFFDVVTAWVQDRRDTERMSREQFVALDSIGRLHAQRQSLLDNIAHFYAINPNADTAPGVLALITIFSDNQNGCCTLSVKRMAAFLSRSPRRITDTIGRLEEQRCIVREPRDNESSELAPWVHQAFGSSKDALTWIVDVRAPKQTAKAAGRPRAPNNTHDAGVTPITEIPLTPVTNTPDAGDRTPLTPASANTTKLNTTNKNTKGVCAHSREEPPQKNNLDRREVTGAKTLQAAFDAENFWPPSNPCAWLTAANAEPSLSSLTSAEATEIARAAKASNSVANGKRPEMPGVGELIKLAAHHKRTQRKDPKSNSAIPENQWRELVAQFADDDMWSVYELGPAPASGKCVVPKHIIQELRLDEKYDQNGIARRRI